MAENKDGMEKSEQATQKRLDEARDRGQVSKSQDVTSAVVLLFGGLVIALSGPSMMHLCRDFMGYLLTNSAKIELTDQNVIKYYPELLLFMGRILAPIVGTIFVAILASEIGQLGGFHFASKKFTDPQMIFQHFNLMKGLKRIFFSSQSIFELGKSVAKLSIIVAVVYSIIGKRISEIVSVSEKPFTEISNLMSDLAFELILKISFTYAIIACADFFYQKWKFNNEMKMTKQEVKDEMKQSEGNPKMKARIRQIVRGRLRKLMMKNIALADVVITNPTHFAVAIEYNSGNMDAPKVLAKGADFLAARIREEAKLHNIPIVEDPPLCRAIYFNTDVDEEIPENLFKAVAQVLAYVYSLKKKVI